MSESPAVENSPLTAHTCPARNAEWVGGTRVITPPAQPVAPVVRAPAAPTTTTGGLDADRLVELMRRRRMFGQSVFKR